jgi:hypothetical protein
VKTALRGVFLEVQIVQISIPEGNLVQGFKELHSIQGENN